MALFCAMASGAPAATAQDRHPAGHCPFASAGRPQTEGEVLRPGRCVQGTAGADFHPALDLRPVTLIVRKGFRPHIDSCSAFFENDRKTPAGPAAYLNGPGVGTVYLGGLAAGYCVFFTAMGEVKLKFTVYLPGDAVRGVNYPEGSVEKALSAMKSAGAVLL